VQRTYLGALYDAGVAYADAQVGALLDRLREAGLLERSMVVLTSDHGEEFREHGRFLHSQVYQELVRVPLIVSAPGLPAGRVAGLAQLSDIAPTVLDWLGLAAPPEMQGRSLLPLLERARPARELAHTRNEDGSQYGLTDGRYKLVLEQGASPRARLFDLRSDPWERDDVAAREPERTRRMLDLLGRRRDAERAARPSLPPAVPLDPATRRKLEALGYVGGSGR
jgi:arylsulfatase A-like enzyme